MVFNQRDTSGYTEFLFFNSAPQFAPSKVSYEKHFRLQRRIEPKRRLHCPLKSKLSHGQRFSVDPPGAQDVACDPSVHHPCWTPADLLFHYSFVYSALKQSVKLKQVLGPLSSLTTCHWQIGIHIHRPILLSLATGMGFLVRH